MTPFPPLEVRIPGHPSWMAALYKQTGKEDGVAVLVLTVRPSGARPGSAHVTTWTPRGWGWPGSLVSHRSLEESLEAQGAAPSLAAAVSLLVGDPAAMLLQLEVMTS